LKDGDLENYNNAGSWSKLLYYCIYLYLGTYLLCECTVNILSHKILHFETPPVDMQEEVSELAEVNADEAGPFRLPAFEEAPNGVPGEDAGVAEETSEKARPRPGPVAPEIQECWDLWQLVGLPVEKIAVRILTASTFPSL
jgi:hypothetical protein